MLAARTLAVLVSFGAVAHADEPPMLRLGMRLATGVNVDGPRATSWHLLPVSVGVGAEHAFHAQPWTTGWGEIFVEGPDVLSVGVAAGVRVHLADGATRLAAGGAALIRPETKAGATASLGVCFAVEAPRLCADVSGTLFFAGDGLPEEGAAGQLKLVFDVGFDVL